MAEIQHEADDGLSGPINGDYKRKDTQTEAPDPADSRENIGTRPTKYSPESPWENNGNN